MQNVSDCAIPQKFGIHWSVVQGFLLQQYQARCGQCGTDDVRDDHESKRQKVNETHVQQEPSSSSGVKRSTADVEAMRRAVAEAGIETCPHARGTTSSQMRICNTVG